MKRFFYIFCWISSFSLVLKAQDNLPQTVNSTGYYALVNNYMVDYSVGEMTMVETFGFGGGMLTQGFLQSTELNDVTGGNETGIIVWSDMSPNGDGMGHEHLEIENIENYPVNNIEIFNRWGNLVFKMSGYDNAENSFKGFANTGLYVGDKELPDGTYYYILKVFIPANATNEVHTGFFVIKRK